MDSRTPTESNSSAGSSSGAISRGLSSTTTTPPPVPGFIGEGHTAVEVLAPTALAKSDPFVLLMDDRLDIPQRRQIGGAHPHAGLETVTLVLEGTLSDRDEGDLQAGDMIWMTAGRGIIHNEAVEASGRSRILQLWIALPGRDRRLAPRFEVIRRETVPVVQAPGVEARLYSGASGTLRSSTRNRVAVTLVDLTFEPGATFHQTLPANYSGFFYVVDGEVSVGHERVAAGQVGWLAPVAWPGLAANVTTDLEIVAGPAGAHLVLYAGEPIGEPLVQHGPFVAGSPAEIAEFHRQFRAGQFTPMSQVAHDHRAERRPS